MSLVLILVVSLTIRLVVSAYLGPGFDEAYYYSYSLRPSLSYFDHPPFVGFLAGLFPYMSGIVSPLTIRLGAVILFTFTGLLFFTLSRRWLSEREALAAYSLFNFTPLFFVCAGTMILPDSGLVFFWIATLLFLKRLSDGDTRGVTWVLAGIATGCTLLCKYHGLLLCFSLALYLLICRPRAFLTPGPYLYSLSVFIISLPVLVWNMQHGFVSFAFHGARVLAPSISITHFLVALGGQTLYLTPVVFVPLLYVIWLTFRRGIMDNDSEYRFFFFFGTVPILFFNLISFVKPVLPHWTLPGYVALLVPLAHVAVEQWNKRRYVKQASGFFAFAILVFLSLALIQSRYGIFHLEKLIQKGWIPARAFRADPTLDVFGWSEVNRYLCEQGISPERCFLFTHKWFLSGQVELATKGKYKVMCFNPYDPRGFGIWDRNLDMRGKDGIFICSDRYPAEPKKNYGGYFESISGPDRVVIHRSGVPSKTLYFYRCENLLTRYPMPYLP